MRARRWRDGPRGDALGTAGQRIRRSLRGRARVAARAEDDGVRWLAATDETWLLGDVAQMLTVTISTRRSNREDALVDTAGPIICGMGSLRLLLWRHL